MIVQNSIKVLKVSESMKSVLGSSLHLSRSNWTASHQQGVAGEAIAHRRRPQHIGHAAVRVPRRGADLPRRGKRGVSEMLGIRGDQQNWIEGNKHGDFMDFDGNFMGIEAEFMG